MRYVEFLTILSGGILLLGCAQEPPTLALTAGSKDITPESWCRDQGGIVQSYVPRNPEAPTVEQPMCVFRNPDGTRILISTTTLAAPHATLAAVAYVNSPPPPNTDGAINPAAEYCLALGGKTDPAGWYPVNQSPARPVPLCVFADNSIIDTWGLASRASHSPHIRDLTSKFRYRTASPSASKSPPSITPAPGGPD
jgi:putative hemolysin